MKNRSDTSLGDLLHARKTLGLTEAQDIREVATLLGLPVGALPTPPPQEVLLPSISSEEIVPPVHVEVEKPQLLDQPVEAPTSQAVGSNLSVRLERRAPLAPPSWVGEGPVLGEEPDADPLRGMEPPPLLPPGYTRALLGAVVAGEAPGGSIDIHRAVTLLCRGVPLADLPRQLLPTLRFGVQILVDRSPAMLPYRADQRRVVADLQRLVGADRVQVLRFERIPWRAGSGTPRTWRPYTAPARGTTVLILGDLGLCRGDALETEPVTFEWPAFAETLRRSDCRPAALVPHPPERWPPALRTRMKLIFWDRITTVAQARRAVREAR